MDKLSFYEPADIEIYIKDQGIVLKEKSLIAIKTDEKLQKIIVIACGNEVANMNPIPDDIMIFSPLHQGIVEDFTVAKKMFAFFFKKAIKQNLFKTSSISLCIPFKTDEVSLKAYEDLVYVSGKPKKVKFISKGLEEFLQTASPEELNEHKIILNITKDEPLSYVKERAKETLQYAAQYGITKDRLLDIIKEL